MSLNLKPHTYRRQPDTDRAILTELNPYVRLSQEGEAPVFVQGGSFYDASGKAVDPVPQWVKDNIAKMTPGARKEVGLPEVKQPIGFHTVGDKK